MVRLRPSTAGAAASCLRSAGQEQDAGVPVESFGKPNSGVAGPGISARATELLACIGVAASAAGRRTERWDEAADAHTGSFCRGEDLGCHHVPQTLSQTQS